MAVVGVAGLAVISPGTLIPISVAGLLPWLASVFYFDLRTDLMYLLGIFLIPSWLVLALLASVGAGMLAGRRQIVIPLLAVVLLISLVVFQSRHARPYNESRETWSFDLGRSLLAPLPPGAGLVVASDLDTFPLWYMQQVEGFRVDVLVVNSVIMRHRWYRREISRLSGVPRLADLEDKGRALRHLLGASPRPWFTSAGPIEGIPDDLRRVPYHLTCLLSPESGSRSFPRGFPMRGLAERIAHMPEPTALIAVGYTLEALRNTGNLPPR